MKALLLYGTKAGNPQFPQASLMAIPEERQHEISLARVQACKTGTSEM
jgi:hypothetical protein